MSGTTVCLVTGVSSGIGERLCHQLVAQGHHVIGIARNGARLLELETELGAARFTGYCCDTADQQQVKLVSQKIRNSNMLPHYFFLNAGIGEAEYTLTCDTHHRIFNTNYFGPLYWVEEWLWSAREKGGQFIAVSSLAAVRAAPNAPAYGASKAALKTSFEALRMQYKDTPAGFTVVLPGPVATGMLNRAIAFSWTADQAAARIIRAGFAKESVVRFPWVWAMTYQLLRLLPDSVTIKLLGR